MESIFSCSRDWEDLYIVGVAPRDGLRSRFLDVITSILRKCANGRDGEEYWWTVANAWDDWKYLGPEELDELCKLGNSQS